MDFIAKRIWYITIPTALAVLVFQLYWLHSTYTNQQVSFKQAATNALQKAYDNALMKPVMGNTVKKITNIGATTVQTSAKIKLEAIKGTNLKKMLPSLKSLKHDTVIVINQPNINTSRFISDIMSMSALIKPDTTFLADSYREELKKQGIQIPFKLTIAQKDTDTSIKDTVRTVQISPPGNKEVITAHFTNLNKLLIFKIIWPIVLSFLLVMLITGCIWVLWRIIYQQKKLELMKNDFISNISHELKTPLAILNTTNEVLLNFDGMKDAEKTERYLKLSKNELLKLQNMVEGILALTKMEHTADLLGPFEKVNIEDLLKTAISRFMELPGVNITYDIKISRKIIQTWPEALNTIISNLLDNAIKYTPGAHKFIKITFTEENMHYQLSVMDQGIGIPQHQQPFIFDKFYRVPQGDIHEVKGYGLGLSHVKSLLQKMDADISLNSKPMEGSVFTIQMKKKDERN